MNKLITTLLALCCAANAGDFQTSTNELGEVTSTGSTMSTLMVNNTIVHIMSSHWLTAGIVMYGVDLEPTRHHPPPIRNLFGGPPQ